VRQAIGTAGDVLAPRGAWWQGALRQATPIKQWVWRRWHLATGRYRQAVWACVAYQCWVLRQAKI